jgi:hypothetical protein
LIIGWTLMPPAALVQVFPPEQRTFNPVAQWTSAALSFRFVSTLIVLTACTYIAAPWYGRRDLPHAIRGVSAVGISAVCIFVLYGAMVIGAALPRSAPPLDNAETVVPAMINNGCPLWAQASALRCCSRGTHDHSPVWSAMAAMLNADFRLASSVRGAASRWLLAVLCCRCQLAGGRWLNRLILANIPVAALAICVAGRLSLPRATRRCLGVSGRRCGLGHRLLSRGR